MPCIQQEASVASLMSTMMYHLVPAHVLSGPNLHGLIGRETGSAPGYDYSEANKNRRIVWNEKRLDTYLAHPRAYIPGTKMVFQGVKNAQQRQDLIAFLKEETSS
eukprot:m.211994 g.211994  ORF g.211994 m.211994 type:complete len:105 (+) comp25842_c0_seq1:155-469(+)